MKKKKIFPLTKEEEKLDHEQNFLSYTQEKNLPIIMIMIKSIRDHCHDTGKYRDTAKNICNWRCKTSKEIIVMFHNDSNYDCHFIIKVLAVVFEGQFECLGENTEKYIAFSVAVKKETETIKYKNNI